MRKYKKPAPIPKWSDVPYAGEFTPPLPLEPRTRWWPTFFLKRNRSGDLVGPGGAPVKWAIEDPSKIDFAGEQLDQVIQTLKNLTPQQITSAEYWNAGPATKQWTPIIDRLLDTYAVSPPRSARILGAVQSAGNDIFVLVWHFKFLWNIPRPNQLDRQLATIVCTPDFPAYPSGHAALAGCFQTLLSYFFPGESARLKALAEECAISRIYGGVHFPADGVQGLRLGRQVGRQVARYLAEQVLPSGRPVDTPFRKSRHADLSPPPFVQAIPFERERKCASRLDPRQDPSAR